MSRGMEDCRTTCQLNEVLECTELDALDSARGAGSLPTLAGTAASDDSVGGEDEMFIDLKVAVTDGSRGASSGVVNTFSLGECTPLTEASADMLTSSEVK